jgi:hypothetical protein
MVLEYIIYSSFSCTSIFWTLQFIVVHPSSSSSFLQGPVANAPGCTSASAAYCTLTLDVPTLTTSRLPRDPGGQRWNYVNFLVQVNIRMEQ